jgi:hypothetical protein
MQATRERARWVDLRLRARVERVGRGWPDVRREPMSDEQAGAQVLDGADAEGDAPFREVKA